MGLHVGPDDRISQQGISQVPDLESSEAQTGPGLAQDSTEGLAAPGEGKPSVPGWQGRRGHLGQGWSLEEG